MGAAIQYALLQVVRTTVDTVVAGGDDDANERTNERMERADGRTDGRAGGWDGRHISLDLDMEQ